ncbi:hypothetical protein HYS93_03800 [Candidatus Daviesbacteria bacterium]|nr:hypothetical protein [Candidatus Daviesbacteria bacterium]
MAADFLTEFLPYRRNLLREVTGNTSQGLRIKAEIPPSVTCPDLEHISPSDITLAVMQGAYVLVFTAFKDLPKEYAYRALFLSHNGHYLDQDRGSLDSVFSLRQLRRGAVSALTIDIADPDCLGVQLTGGVFSEEPTAIVEDHLPKGQMVSTDQIVEILSIYRGEKQSEVIALGDSPEDGVYEAAVYFPPYNEVEDLDHVSARQMIEALMKVAYLVAGHQAFIGELPIDYRQFLDSRLLFRTQRHNLRYRKLLAAGSKSLLRCNLSIENNVGIFQFSHRPNVDREQESFATGQMRFYLPESQR